MNATPQDGGSSPNTPPLALQSQSIQAASASGEKQLPTSPTDSLLKLESFVNATQDIQTLQMAQLSLGPVGTAATASSCPTESQAQLAPPDVPHPSTSPDAGQQTISDDPASAVQQFLPIFPLDLPSVAQGTPITSNMVSIYQLEVAIANERERLEASFAKEREQWKKERNILQAKATDGDDRQQVRQRKAFKRARLSKQRDDIEKRLDEISYAGLAIDAVSLKDKLTNHPEKIYGSDPKYVDKKAFLEVRKLLLLGCEAEDLYLKYRELSKQCERKLEADTYELEDIQEDALVYHSIMNSFGQWKEDGGDVGRYGFKDMLADLDASHKNGNTGSRG